MPNRRRALVLLVNLRFLFSVLQCQVADHHLSFELELIKHKSNSLLGPHTKAQSEELVALWAVGDSDVSSKDRLERVRCRVGLGEYSVGCRVRLWGGLCVCSIKVPSKCSLPLSKVVSEIQKPRSM